VEEPLYIKAGESPQSHMKLMRVLPRRVQIQCKEEGTDKEIIPNTIKIDNRVVDLQKGFSIKPGEYSLEIEATDCAVFTETITIDPQDEVYTFVASMKSK
jgi:hypothetical protein